MNDKKPLIVDAVPVQAKDNINGYNAALIREVLNNLKVNGYAPYYSSGPI